jgi:hypothetical protein
MSYQAFRALRPFKWEGWTYAPKGFCGCDCSKPRNVEVADDITDGSVTSRGVHTIVMPGPIPDCGMEAGTGCYCAETVCGCACGMPQRTHGGDIWVVDVGSQLEKQEGRINSMVEISRHAVRDVTAGDEAIDAAGNVKPEFQRFIRRPEANAELAAQLAAKPV